MWLCEPCFASAWQSIHLNGLPCLLESREKVYAGFWKAMHGNCKCSVFPSAVTIPSACGMPLGIMAPARRRHVFLCRWLRLREQVWTCSENHLHRWEPSRIQYAILLISVTPPQCFPYESVAFIFLLRKFWSQLQTLTVFSSIFFITGITIHRPSQCYIIAQSSEAQIT